MTRIGFAMGRDGLLPPSVAQVSPRTGTPLRMTVLFSLLVLAMAMFIPLGVQLMANLSVEMWLRFLAWLLLGPLVYAVYGYRHSRLRRVDASGGVGTATSMSRGGDDDCRAVTNTPGTSPRLTGGGNRMPFGMWDRRTYTSRPQSDCGQE